MHPASAWLANESAHIEDELADHDLHVFQAIRRMDEILVNNFMVFNDVVDESYYDLVIGDEAWDVSMILHETRSSAVRLRVDDRLRGRLRMPGGGRRGRPRPALLQRRDARGSARDRCLRDGSIFVGNPDDIVDESFGPGMVGASGTGQKQRYHFAGYVTGFTADGAEALRGTITLRVPRRRRWIVTVGGPQSVMCSSPCHGCDSARAAGSPTGSSS